MIIKRMITEEGKNGVTTRTDTFDTSTIDFLTNIWEFDQVPNLPLQPEQVLGEYEKMGIFGPLGGIRIDLFTLAPEMDKVPAALERAASIDMGTPGMIPGKEGDGMHRTNSIDFAVILEGEVNAGYPGEDGQVHEVNMNTGNLIITNGTFHSWHNRSDKDCTILFFVLAVERLAS